MGPAALFLLVAWGVPARAAPGDLDPTFGRGGHITTDFFGKEDVGWAVAIQPNGKIVTAGSVRQGSDWNMGLARYTTHGSLDQSFGNGGLVVTDFGGATDDAHAVAVQADGKIVVAGDASEGSSLHFALARYHDDGTLDATFGDGGKVTAGFGQDATFWDLAVQADGAIVAAGSAVSDHGGAPQVVVMRFLPDGSPDVSFASHGRWVDRTSRVATAVAIQADGRIVVAGYGISQPGRGADFYVARLNTDGTPDPTFGSNGRVLTDFSHNYDLAFDLVIQPDGDLVVGGGSSSDLGLARYLTNGSLDATFGDGGLVTTDLGSTDAVFGLALQSDGKIVAVGDSFLALQEGGWATARYEADGSLDATFGDGGVVLDLFAGHFGGLFRGVVIQSDGKVVAAGWANGPVGSPNSAFALARYLG